MPTGCISARCNCGATVGVCNCLCHEARALGDIDAVLAALVDIKPMAAYGVVGSYDTVQARRQKALAKAEESLLALRRKLDSTHGVPGTPETSDQLVTGD